MSYPLGATPWRATIWRATSKIKFLVLISLIQRNLKIKKSYDKKIIKIQHNKGFYDLELPPKNLPDGKIVVINKMSHKNDI